MIPNLDVFTWSDNSDPKDAEGRKSYLFTVKPMAKLMSIVQFKNNSYLVMCLGHQQRFPAMPLDIMKQKAEQWFSEILIQLNVDLAARLAA